VQPIPLGVADDGRLAVVGTRSGALVAIDPGRGTVRWRAGRGLRPCAVTADSVVALRSVPPAPPEVVVLDATDGRELWTAGLPAPAMPSDRWSVELSCTVEDGVVVLRWATAAHYEGGAAPSRRVLEDSAQRAAGAVRIDLRARTVQAAAPVDAEEAVPEAAPTAPPLLAPDVVLHGWLGDLRLELVAPPGTGDVVLRAVDAASNAQTWQVVVDQQAPRRPPPLRP
jgi:hypothetical protein